MTDTTKSFDDELCPTTIGLPRRLLRRVKARAAMEDRQISDLVTSAMVEYLGAHEQVEGFGDQNVGDIEFITLTPLQAIAKRPYLYVATRKEFLAFMCGYITGHASGLLVPGPDFKAFEVDMDSPPTGEWAEPVVEYVHTYLEGKT